MTILSKILQVKADLEFFKRYKMDNQKFDYLIRKYDRYSGTAYVQLIGSSFHPDAQHRPRSEDINKEIENFSKWVTMDSIRRDPSRSRTLLEDRGVTKQVETWSNHPGLSGENDHIRSKMRKVRHIAVPKITIREINDRFEREGKPSLEAPEDWIENPKTGEQMFIVKVGEVDSD